MNQHNNNTNQLIAYLQLTKASILTSMRNKTTLFFNFFFPFIFITIFGMLNYGDVTFDVAIREDSKKEGVVYEALKKVEVLKLISDQSDEKITDDLKKGRTAVAITIKEIPAQSPKLPPTYGILVEQSTASPQSAASIMSIVDTVIGSINASVSQNSFTLVSKSTEAVEGRKYKQIDFILPGQLAFALIMNALFGIAFTFVTYRKNLILKRYFATPVKKSTIMAGEITGKAFIAILQAIIIIGAGHYLFGFTLAHGFSTFISMLVLSLVGILSFLSFGLIIPTIGKTEDSVSPISQVIMMPQLFLSGAFFPIEAFPKFIQPIAQILPMTLLSDAFKKVAFEGVPLSDTIPQMIGLLIWGAIIYTLVVIFFKWEE
jgi:ABC-2 type transport system permease protein